MLSAAREVKSVRSVGVSATVEYWSRCARWWDFWNLDRDRNEGEIDEIGAKTSPLGSAPGVCRRRQRTYIIAFRYYYFSPLDGGPFAPPIYYYYYMSWS